MGAPVKVNTAVGSVWFNLISQSQAYRLHLYKRRAGEDQQHPLLHPYRMSGKSLRPMTMEAYTHPEHELIPGSLAQKIAQFILPAAIQRLATQTVLSPA